MNYCIKCGAKKCTDQGDYCKSCRPQCGRNELSVEESEDAYSEFRWNIIMNCYGGFRTVRIPLIKCRQVNS